VPGTSVPLHGEKYGFELILDSVDANGDVEENIRWFNGNEPGRSFIQVHGKSNGTHLILKDDDGDVKEIQITGDSMGGTDKGGRAWLGAKLVPAEPLP